MVLNTTAKQNERFWKNGYLILGVDGRDWSLLLVSCVSTRGDPPHRRGAQSAASRLRRGLALVLGVMKGAPPVKRDPHDGSVARVIFLRSRPRPALGRECGSFLNGGPKFRPIVASGSPRGYDSRVPANPYAPFYPRPGSRSDGSSARKSTPRRRRFGVGHGHSTAASNSKLRSRQTG